LRFFVMMRSVFAPASFVMALALAACSASNDAPATSNPPAPPAPAATTPDPGPGPAPAMAPTACDLENTALQKGLDGAHAKTTGAVLAIRNPTCGARTLVSGPTKIDATSLHRIGSVTKTFTASVILSLVKEGTLGLDDKVSKWVTGVTGGDGITLRQLLDHSSGLFNYTDDTAFQKTAPDHVFTPRELVDIGLRNPVYFAPGSSWHYSNTNFILLGMVAEAAGQAKIGVLVRTRVLDKAGLTSTFFDGEETIGGKLAPAQSAQGKDFTTILDPSWAWAAGAIVATPGDVALWIEKVGSGTFYDAPIQKELLTTVHTDSPELGYGLGIMVFDPSITAGAGIGIGHDGSIPGYQTQSFHFPDKKTTLVSIVDSDGDSPNDVSLAALNVLFP
jgi:D-alanyl-D-alanine carboxypeptidase